MCLTPVAATRRPFVVLTSNATRELSEALKRRCLYLHLDYPTADREKALDYGAQEFLDLENDALESVGQVDLVFDVIGSDVQKRSAEVIKPGGTLVSVVGPVETRPTDGLAVDFVVEADRAQLGEIVQRVRDGRLRRNIGTTASLDDAVTALNSTERRKGKTIVRVRA